MSPELAFWETRKPSIIRLVGRTVVYIARNRSLCKPITAKCIMPRFSSFFCKWSDVEQTFGYNCSVLSEFFWDVMCSFHTPWARFVQKFRIELLHEREQISTRSGMKRKGPLLLCLLISSTARRFALWGLVVQTFCKKAYTLIINVRVCYCFKRRPLLMGSFSTCLGRYKVGRTTLQSIVSSTWMRNYQMSWWWVAGSTVSMAILPISILREWSQVSLEWLGATAEPCLNNKSMNSVAKR